jgi:hypothetical protein
MTALTERRAVRDRRRDTPEERKATLRRVCELSDDRRILLLHYLIGALGVDRVSAELDVLEIQPRADQ